MKSVSKLICFFYVVLCLGVTVAESALHDVPQRAEINMDFKGVELHNFIKFISEVTGRNFVVDPAVKGKVSVFSPVPVTQEEAYQTFVSVLRVHGYTVARNGSVYKIMPAKEGLGQNAGVHIGFAAEGEGDDSLVTQIVPLEKVVAEEMAKIIPGVLGRSYSVSVYPPGNILIMTAPRTNIKKALTFIQMAEAAPLTGRAEMISLEHGSAKNLADSLGKMLKARDDDQGKKGRKMSSFVQADERTNSLLVFADAEGIAMIKNTVAQLDVPTPKGKGDVHLVALANAKAEDMATVLNTLVERQRSTAQDEAAKDTSLSKDIKVVADNATNSLLITARPDEFESLQQVIKKLDIVRKQVFIEALIMEASSDANFSFGVNWVAGGSGDDDTYILGGASLGGGNIGLGSSGIVTMPSGGSIGAVISDAFSVGGSFYSIQAVISGLEGNSDVDILATPQLLALDNEEASVEVVDNVPFTKESTAKNDLDFTTQSVDYKDVGVKLKIIPRISDNGSLRLEIEQEVSRVTQNVVTMGGGQQILAPTTRKRYVKTTILMEDGQTAVIAGLLSSDSTYSENKVPGLGDVPLLGWLFKSRNKRSTKTNLFIFITPHVLRSREDSERLMVEKKVLLHRTAIGSDGLAKPVMSMPKLGYALHAP